MDNCQAAEYSFRELFDLLEMCEKWHMRSFSGHKHISLSLSLLSWSKYIQVIDGFCQVIQR